MVEENQETQEELNENGQEEETEQKTFTEEEFHKALQKETDRAVTKALETNKQKLEAEFQARLEAEKEEVVNTANMTAEEKAKAEFEAQKAEWEKEKSEFEKQKLELSTTKKMNSEGLPTDFASLVIGADEEETDSNIEMFKSHWQKALEEAVNNRLKGATPKAGNSKPSAVMTKEEFGKLGYKDRNKLLEKDPELMKKLK